MIEVLFETGVPWFPQNYADDFYVAKGILALIATLFLIAHMSRTWARTDGWGQRLRYLTLFYFAVLLTASSVEQTSQHALVNYRNIGGIVGAVLCIVAAAVSLHETRRK